MKAFIVSIIFLCSIGCVKDIRLDDSHPLYAKPTLTLQEKAYYHEAFIWANCIDADGLMLYSRPFKYDVNGMKVPDLDNLTAYNKADYPGWQGQFISALAFKWAATGQSQEGEIMFALSALEKCYEVTGIPGQLVRAYVKYDGDTLLPWMKSYERARDTNDLAQGWWQKGQNGYWFRNQVAGGHHQGVFAAICILGGLQQQGKINLSDAAQQRIKDFITPLYNRIHDNNNEVADIDGKTTGFGWVFSRIWHLTRMRAASVWGVVEAQREYDLYIEDYASIIKIQYFFLVPILERLWLDSRKPGGSDIQWEYQAWMALVVANGAASSEAMRDIRRGFQYLFRVHNPSNAQNYVTQKAADTDLNDVYLHSTAIEAMEWYPVDKFDFVTQQSVTTPDKWQPVQNRDPTTSYAKNAGYHRALLGDFTGGVRGLQYMCGFDYVYTYWAARYFGIVQGD